MASERNIHTPSRGHACMKEQSLSSACTYMKGQSSIMEYLFMSFFTLMVIIVLIFFLMWFQFNQYSMEQQRIKLEKSDVLINRLVSSPLFVKENSVFDDARLMAIDSLGPELCHDMERLFGNNWFMEIDILNPRPGCGGECTASSYPCCGYWEICPATFEPAEMNKRVLPVNVYRNAEDRTDLAVLRVGVYQ